MRIDVHTHVWPDKIAERALSGAGLDIPVRGDGTVAGLEQVMRGAGIDRAVCLGVANLPEQVDGANRFAGSLNSRPGLIGFGSVHAGLTPAENVDSLRRHGLAGAKVHPLFQDYRLDDPSLLETLDAMRDDFVVITHVGSGKDPSVSARCTPPMLRDLIRQLPGLRLVACHFGGFRELEQAEELIVGQDVYLDTSWPPSLADLDPDRIGRLIERHGPDRVVFASDWPMADPAREIEAIENLGLSAEATAGILGENFAALLAG